MTNPVPGTRFVTARGSRARPTRMRADLRAERLS